MKIIRLTRPAMFHLFEPTIFLNPCGLYSYPGIVYSIIGHKPRRMYSESLQLPSIFFMDGRNGYPLRVTNSSPRY